VSADLKPVAKDSIDTSDLERMETERTALEELALADFAGLTEKDGTLASWDHVDQFGICAHHEGSGIPSEESRWNGPGAQFRRLEWV
jgi:hypothetical protein